jgi:hypothetical protein
VQKAQAKVDVLREEQKDAVAGSSVEWSDGDKVRMSCWFHGQQFLQVIEFVKGESLTTVLSQSKDLKVRDDVFSKLGGLASFDILVNNIFDRFPVVHRNPGNPAILIFRRSRSETTLELFSIDYAAVPITDPEGIKTYTGCVRDTIKDVKRFVQLGGETTVDGNDRSNDIELDDHEWAAL